ncbi:hypothetical protein [Enterobacter phage N5822]|nr:hypothetical protein [Enterobacter phage N5822]QPD96235.1 hypothetical protein [Enterobacter phage N5822]
MIAGLDNPKLKTFRGSVYLYNGETYLAEIYRASNMKEQGILSSMNQLSKYRKWMQ